MGHRILLVDDDQQIREWLQMDLQFSGFSMDSAADGLDGLNKAQQNHYDLIILDVMMPKIDGYEVCKTIRASNKDVPIILLTAKGTLEDKITGFNCGADDYLVKPFDIQELLVRIRALFRRSVKQINETGEILESGIFKLFPDSLEVRIDDKLIKLTPTEFEIIYCLMQHVNQAVNLQTLLKEVWGYDMDEDVRMVRVHMGGLRQKIEIDPKLPKFVQTVTNVGYKLVPYFEN